MASRKPLVIISGQLQEIPAGDSLSTAASEVDVVSMTNANVGALTIGVAVYVSVAGSVDKANAAATGTKNVLGLVGQASIAAAGSGVIQTDGILSNADWTAAAGAADLVAGSIYYLSAATAGLITATAPTASGNFVVPVGLAISARELDITVSQGMSVKIA